ncbi:hypothetical protein D7X33_46795, partial [Butyricicoccus sp. 1XD8-22]
MKHYALFTLIAHFPIENKRRDYYEWFVEICQQSKVENLNKIIIQQWNTPNKKANWAVQGKEVARIAYTISYESGDFEFQNLFVTVLFAHGLMKAMKKQEQRENTSISI